MIKQVLGSIEFMREVRNSYFYYMKQNSWFDEKMLERMQANLDKVEDEMTERLIEFESQMESIQAQIDKFRKKNQTRH